MELHGKLFCPFAVWEICPFLIYSLDQYVTPWVKQAYTEAKLKKIIIIKKKKKRLLDMAQDSLLMAATLWSSFSQENTWTQSKRFLKCELKWTTGPTDSK